MNGPPETQRGPALATPGPNALQGTETNRQPTPQAIQELEFRLMIEPGLIEYQQGWHDGREALMRELAERVDCLDNTWQTITRPTWEEQVAARVAAMVKNASKFRCANAIADVDHRGQAPGRGTAA